MSYGTCNLYQGYQEDLNRKGLRCYDISQINEFCTDGIILPDGIFVFCGYMGHQKLFDTMNKLGIAVRHNYWTDNIDCIIISSGSLHGNVTFKMREPDFKAALDPTDSQLNTLYAMREILHGTYEDRTTVMKLLLDYEQRNAKHNGLKYCNLQFLKKYYTDIDTPDIEKHWTHFKPYLRKLIIRTSPIESIAGVLTSKVVDFNREYDNEYDRPLEYGCEIELNTKQIYREFEEYLKEYDPQEYIKLSNDKSSLKYYSRLPIFYQRYIYGMNGVCGYSQDNGFNYSLSDNRGDVVNGKVGNLELSPNIQSELETITRRLHNDLGEREIQLEFVIDGSTITILQLRVFEKQYLGDDTPLENTFVTGKTFTKRHKIILDVNDILIVDDDCDSKQLFNKKALIVKNNQQFSHILALSRTLNIPSIYNVEHINLPKTGMVEFNTTNKIGWVTTHQ
jgi:hypothetical protein